MKYPESRLRRLRYNKNIRSLVQDVEINISDLIYPIFVCEGNNVKDEIESLKGQYRLSTDNVIEKCEQLIKLGIKSILLFSFSSASLPLFADITLKSFFFKLYDKRSIISFSSSTIRILCFIII